MVDSFLFSLKIMCQNKEDDREKIMHMRVGRRQLYKRTQNLFFHHFFLLARTLFSCSFFLFLPVVCGYYVSQFLQRHLYNRQTREGEKRKTFKHTFTSILFFFFFFFFFYSIQLSGVCSNN